MNDLRLLIVAVIWAETPKSANLTSPNSVSNMLAPYGHKIINKQLVTHKRNLRASV